MASRALTRRFYTSGKPRCADHLKNEQAFPPQDPLGYFSSTHTMSFKPRSSFSRLTEVYRLSGRGRGEEQLHRLEAKVAKEREAVAEDAYAMREDPLADAGRRSAFGEMCRKVWQKEKEGGASSQDQPSSSSSSSKPGSSSKSARRTAPRFHRGVHSGDAFRRPGSGPASSRSFSSSAIIALSSASPGFESPVAARRASELASKVPADKVIDLRLIMDDLRDLELLDMLREVKPKAATGFKAATRALYPLFHQLEQGKVQKVTFADLQHALPPIFTLPWTSIAERLLSGKLAKLDSLSAKDKAQLLFLQIYNIGPTRAWKYANEGCRTLEDLQKRQDKLKLTKAQAIGLKHREDINRLIPRDEVEKLKVVLEKALQAIDPKFECEVLGSYRRGVDFSSDLDLAVRHPDFVDKDDEKTSKPMMASIVKYLEKHKLLEKENQLMLGGKKYAGLIRLPRHKHYRRIDIRLAPYHSYPYMLLGSSGDALLMKLLRHTAKERGMCLNEYGMGEKYDAEDQNPNGFKPGTMRLVKSEREIFDLLGMPYLEPQEREYKIWATKYKAARIPGVDYLYRL